MGGARFWAFRVPRRKESAQTICPTSITFEPRSIKGPDPAPLITHHPKFWAGAARRNLFAPGSKFGGGVANYLGGGKPDTPSAVVLQMQW